MIFPESLFNVNLNQAYGEYVQNNMSAREKLMMGKWNDVDFETIRLNIYFK